MPGQPDQRCETCKYGYHKKESIYICRRYPPTTQPSFIEECKICEHLKRQNGSVIKSYASHYPVVHKDDWCGEWKQ